MKQLLFLTGLPTIKQLVIDNSRVIISQVEAMKPEWFIHPRRRTALKESKRKEKIIQLLIPYHVSNNINILHAPHDYDLLPAERII